LSFVVRHSSIIKKRLVEDHERRIINATKEVISRAQTASHADAPSPFPRREIRHRVTHLSQAGCTQPVQVVRCEMLNTADVPRVYL